MRRRMALGAAVVFGLLGGCDGIGEIPPVETCESESEKILAACPAGTTGRIVTSGTACTAGEIYDANGQLVGECVEVDGCFAECTAREELACTCGLIKVSNQQYECRTDCGDCGNGITEAGEECDLGDGVNGPGAACSAVCSTQFDCGNGIVETGEECDLGDGVNGPGSSCSTTCQDQGYCDDGVTQPELGEECDDGAEMNGVGTCNDQCKYDPECETGAERCDGNGVVRERCGQGQWEVLENCGAVIDGGICDQGPAGPRCREACGPSEDYCDDENRCVATLTDVDHCGGCGVACGPAGDPNATMTCQSGSCVEECDDGYEDCGAAGCVDTDSDPAHCGGCGVTLDTYELCVDGVPTLSCASFGLDQCGQGSLARCVDLASDAENCGSCGEVCPGGTCEGGYCTSCSWDVGEFQISIPGACGEGAGPSRTCPNMRPNIILRREAAGTVAISQANAQLVLWFSNADGDLPEGLWSMNSPGTHAMSLDVTAQQPFSGGDATVELMAYDAWAPCGGGSFSDVTFAIEEN